MIKRSVNPVLLEDEDGKKTISGWSLRKGSFKRFMRCYGEYLVECVENLERPISLISYYLSTKNKGFYPKCRVIDLYIRHFEANKDTM